LGKKGERKRRKQGRNGKRKRTLFFVEQGPIILLYFSSSPSGSEEKDFCPEEKIEVASK
jgi:hypothetical protein